MTMRTYTCHIHDSWDLDFPSEVRKWKVKTQVLYFVAVKAGVKAHIWFCWNLHTTENGHFHWFTITVVFVQEKAGLSARLEEMMEQSLALFQKRDDLDELEGFQQQELAKVKHMVRTHGVEVLDLQHL